MKTEFIICTYVPRDVQRFSHACAATVLLAASLDWDIIEKPNKATILRAHDGTVIELPDHENVRFNVYRSWINKLATHSVEFVLPMDVVTKIADVCKLSRDHTRVIADLAEQSVVPDSTPDGVPVEPPPTIVSREPYMAHYKGINTYQSAASYERIWSDGHKDYECMVCGEAFPSPKSLGGHRQAHIAAGEAEPVWKDSIRDAVRGVDPDWQITPRSVPEPPPELPLEPPVTTVERPTLDRFRANVDELVATAEALIEENESLRRQLAKIRGDFASLVSIIQELQAEE